MKHQFKINCEGKLLTDKDIKSNIISRYLRTTQGRSMLAQSMAENWIILELQENVFQ